MNPERVESVLRPVISCAVLSYFCCSGIVVSLGGHGVLPGSGLSQQRWGVGGLVFQPADDIPIVELRVSHAIPPPGQLPHRRVGEDE